MLDGAQSVFWSGDHITYQELIGLLRRKDANNAQGGSTATVQFVHIERCAKA